jgi:ABC-type glycerol-3-phosphate transport system substrate-binding protein
MIWTKKFVLSILCVGVFFAIGVIGPNAGAVERPVTLVVGNDGELKWDPGTVWQQQEFERLYPHIKIQFQIIPWKIHQETLITMIAGAREPFDVTQTWYSWLPGARKAGFFQSLDDIFTPYELALYPEGFREIMTDPDRGYIDSLPCFVNVQTFVYNTKIFKEAGLSSPPRTWEELVTYAQKLTTKDVWGFTAPITDLPDVAPWFFQAGTRLFNPDGTAAFNNDAGVKALQYIVDWHNKYKIVPPGMHTYTLEQQMMFIKEKIAMVQGDAFIIDRALNADESQVKDKLGVTPLPVGPAGNNKGTVSPMMYCIPLRAKHSEAAKLWLDYIASYSAQKGMMIYELGNFVAVPAVYDDPEVKLTVPYVDILKESAANSFSVLHPELDEAEKILVSEIQNAFLQQKTAEQALNDAAKQINLLGE